jgi:predicted nucleotidyltransferase
MRISEFEQKCILETFNTLSTAKSKIYLFGSRLDDMKKGGDIDLLIVFVNNEFKFNFKHLDFIVELKKKIGERKIDVTLAAEEELTNDVFLMSVMDSAVEIIP